MKKKDEVEKHTYFWKGPSPLLPTTRKSGWTRRTSWQMTSLASPFLIHASQATYVDISIRSSTATLSSPYNWPDWCAKTYTKMSIWKGKLYNINSQSTSNYIPQFHDSDSQSTPKDEDF